MATTRSSLASSLLFYCLLRVTVSSASVETICKKITTVEGNGVDYDFCVGILDSNPASAASDERGIAIIASKLGFMKIQCTLNKMSNLSNTPYRTDCWQLYDDVGAKLLAAGTAINGGRYSEANVGFSFCMNVAILCEDGFWQNKLLVHPLTANGSELYQICAVGASLTNPAT